MPAHYRASVTEFVEHPTLSVIGRLTHAASQAGYFQQIHTQTEAWRVGIDLLKDCFRQLSSLCDIASWHILLEYPIPRRGKRIDAVLLAAGSVVVLELKCGDNRYAREAVAQVEDYCLDLSDFHQESRGRSIVPLLVATEAPGVSILPAESHECVKPTWRANAHDLADKLQQCIDRACQEAMPALDPARWDASDYSPTPTIIEAAQALYAGQNVREISRCHGGVVNLTTTTTAVLGAIHEARSQGCKLICFITGVPGAGKTLAGLNIVHNRELHDGELGVFLSGNGPLVRVLTEALARDAARRDRVPVSQARRKVSTFIQNVHRFIDAYYSAPESLPVDRVVIFDEAQRAWDAAQSQRKFKRPFSEPEILLEIMDRHPDWAVIVALVGSGQEINRGEAGLAEWGRTLLSRFPHWSVWVSPDLKAGSRTGESYLFESDPTTITVREEAALHLSVNLRSFKAEALSEFVAQLLNLNSDEARALMPVLRDYPLVMTRDLHTAKQWLRQRQRGHRRIGLVASSGARRLRAHGLDVTLDLDVENWLLNGPEDVRSSYYLEVPATEFGIQGLELDWTAVAWGGDLYPAPEGWRCRAFRGTKWVKVHDEISQQYIINKYRVLLTRAREGMVIWVPPGDHSDPTRPPHVYDSVADYLQRCGVTEIKSSPPDNA